MSLFVIASIHTFHSYAPIVQNLYKERDFEIWRNRVSLEIETNKYISYISSEVLANFLFGILDLRQNLRNQQFSINKFEVKKTKLDWMHIF